MATVKTQTPLMLGENYIYPLTTADQVILADGTRLMKNGKITADDAQKLGGKNASEYALANHIHTESGITGALTSDPREEESGEPETGNPIPINADQLGGVNATEYAKKTDIADFATKAYTNTTIIKQTYNSGRITQKPVNINISAPEGYTVLTATGVRSNGYTLPAYALYNDNLVQIWWLADIDDNAIEITFDVDVLFVRK